MERERQQNDSLVNCYNKDHQYGNISMSGFRENLVAVRNVGLSTTPPTPFWYAARSIALVAAVLTDLHEPVLVCVLLCCGYLPPSLLTAAGL